MISVNRTGRPRRFVTPNLSIPSFEPELFRPGQLGPTALYEVVLGPLAFAAEDPVPTVFGHPEEYHAVVKLAAPAMDYAPHFLMYNRILNPWGRDRELPQVAKQSFREWYLENRSQDANLQK